MRDNNQITGVKRKAAIKKFNRASLKPYPRIIKKNKSIKKKGAI